MQLDPLRRPPAALAGDDHIILAVRAKQDRLEDAALADRFGELLERFFAELDSRLIGIATDPRNFDLAHAAVAFGLICLRMWRARRLPEQRLQAHSKALGRTLRAHAASASWGRRPISSRASRT